ncbi:zinc-finger domain-containing protein [Henriciella litoralis]|uniref:zinc-finger domain-containing protein n=1 Tax=Henriciella litoralis TaxID=568102 RepID=UPI000A0097E6|nr:zinc-finger domain-containing protein [Henriciella litoralis]
MAIETLPDAPETIVTEEHHVACDGGNGPLGHPVVWYEMGDDEMAECGYCDRRFVLKGGRYDPNHQ